MQIDLLITKTVLTVILIAVGVGLIAAVGFIVFYCINKQKKDVAFVMQNSIRIRKLKKLNECYQFYKIDRTLTENERCKSKREFDKFGLNNILERFNSDPNHYEVLFCKADYNKENYKEYLQLYNSIIKLKDNINFKRCKIKKEKFEKIEKKKLQQLKKVPALEFNYQLNVTYASPQEKNNCNKKYSWNYKEMKHHFFAAREKWYSEH